MEIFKKKQTPIENITFIAMLSGVSAVLSLIFGFFPLSEIFIILFIPMIHALGARLLEDKFIPLLMGASLILSLGMSFHNFGAGIFYLAPSIIVGCLYGFLMKKKWPIFLLVISCALVELSLNYSLLPLANIISGLDIIATTKALFGLSKFVYIDDIIPTFLFMWALCEVAISHVLITIILPNFRIEPLEINDHGFLAPILGITFILGGFCTGFLTAPVGFLLIAVGIYFSIFAIENYLRKNPIWIYVVLGGLLVLSLFLFATLYQFMPRDLGFGLIGIFFVSSDLVSLALALLLLSKNKGKEVSHG
ncbi:MAG: hypothetical protein K5694_03545 [Bacilli bacterium]|nr:hypothetical protein [Bacilli bacterium]